MPYGPSAAGTTDFDWRLQIEAWLKSAMEVLVLAMVFLSPWAYGAVTPQVELWLYGVLALLMVLWTVKILLRFRVSWERCPVSLCLGGLILLALWQLVPLPRDFIEVISPSTSQLYNRLLPTEQEDLKSPVKLPELAPGSTLSVYPYGTRRELFRLLAVFLMFVVVRNCVATPDSFRRFCIAGVLFGGALSLFALIQFFTSPRDVIYWSIPTGGTVFGPFICRNHFPFFINICFGLGLGLLCSRLGTPRKAAMSGPDAGWPQESVGNQGLSSSFFNLLHQPQQLWILFSLVLMAISVVFCGSRGGFLVFLGGGIVAMTLWFRRSPQFILLETGLLVVALSVGLLGWFGMERVQAQFGTLLEDQALKDDRMTLMARSVPLIRDFPIFGAGFGSLDYVEPIYRTDAADAGWSYQHAHNEYLEALIEGGAVRLILSLLAIVLVYGLGYRTYRRLEGQPAAGLLLGCLFGFTTLVLHSFVDFGLHIPAIAVLATVLCVHMVSMDQQGAGPIAGSGRTSWRLLHGVSAISVAGVLMLLATSLLAEGRKQVAVRKLSSASLALKKSADASSQVQRILLLKQAALLDPANPRLHYDIGERHVILFDALNKKKQDRNKIVEAINTVLVPNPWCAPTCEWTGLLGLCVVKANQERRTLISRDVGYSHLVPALWHFLQARDLSPTRAKTHLELATYIEFFKSSDGRKAYLDRASALDPANPEIWYRAGALNLRDGNYHSAWNAWRQSLALSDRFLEKILDRTLRLAHDEVMDQLLPAKPEILLLAANYRYPKEDAPQRRAFLEKARGLLMASTGPLTPEALRCKGQVFAALGDAKQAVAAYKEALLHDPTQANWRFELATVLYGQAQFAEARNELLTILASQPKNGAARDLLAKSVRESVTKPRR